MLGDLNARVGNEEAHGVMGKYGVPGRNVSRKTLLELCFELELVVGNTNLFNYKITYFIC